MKNGKIIGLAWEQTFQQAFHKCQEYVFIWREESQQPNLHNTFFYETVTTCQLFFDALASLEPNQVRPKSLKSLKSPKLLKITKINNHKNFTLSAKLSGEANKGGDDLIKVVQRWEIYDFFHFQCGSFSVLCVEVYYF